MPDEEEESIPLLWAHRYCVGLIAELIYAEPLCPDKFILLDLTLTN